MKIAALSCKVLPGSKLLLSHVPIRNGVFLLTPFNCKFLGGKGVPRGVAFTDLSNLLVNEM